MDVSPWLHEKSHRKSLGQEKCGCSVTECTENRRQDQFLSSGSLFLTELHTGSSGEDKKIYDG